MQVLLDNISETANIRLRIVDSSELQVKKACFFLSNSQRLTPFTNLSLFSTALFLRELKNFTISFADFFMNFDKLNFLEYNLLTNVSLCIY